MRFEFLIPKRPVSSQTKNRSHLQKWKNYVQAEAAKSWMDAPRSDIEIHLMLVYLYDSDPVDTDNIVKAIQDALSGLIYADDLLITDVEAHRRPLTGTFDLTRCPPVLIQGITTGAECVYVRVSNADSLESYL
jgi:crossover junction endodeoxyribonuclease RusA